MTRRLPAHAKGYLREALVEARAIQDNCWRAEALSVLAERLPASEAQDVLGEALATACAIEEDGERASALSEVFKRLPADAQDLLSKALVAVRETQDTSWRVVLMNNMSAHLGAGGSNLIGELLKIAQTLKDRERFDFITRHSQYWSLLAPVQSEGELLTKLLFPPPRMSRGEFLEVLTSLIPVIHKAGGEHALHELVRAVRDTAEWWP